MNTEKSLREHLARVSADAVPIAAQKTAFVAGSSCTKIRI